MVFVRFRSMALLLMLLVASDPARAELSTLFDPYQQLLSDYLQEKMLDGGGLVTAFDYRAALDARDTTSRLKSQRESLAQFDPASLEGQAESTAFWINAYNFFMIDQILTRPLIGHIHQLGAQANFRAHNNRVQEPDFIQTIIQSRRDIIGGAAMFHGQARYQRQGQVTVGDGVFKR